MPRPCGETLGNTKILWKVPTQKAGTTLVVRALRLDAPDAMPAQSFRRAYDACPGTSFPSGIDVSSRGCWLLTIRSGKAAGHPCGAAGHRLR
jgi:hypothetical protein